MKIYITNLTQYNAGRLISKWLELPCSEEELQDAISRIACNGEEYFITDSEGIPSDVGEYDNLYRLNEKLELYEELKRHCVSQGPMKLKLQNYFSINIPPFATVEENSTFPDHLLLSPP